MTVTVSSSENLRTNPTLVQLTETKPVKDDEGAVSLVSPIEPGGVVADGHPHHLDGHLQERGGQASKQYVAVTASDAAGNEAMKGVAASESDLVSFQVDGCPRAEIRGRRGQGP